MTVQWTGVRVIGVMIAFLMSSASANGAAAQDRSVLAGVVVNAAGDPLAGVVVHVEGTQAGALSDARGGFRIAGVPGGAQVVVAQLLGYEVLRTEVRPGVPEPLVLRMREAAVRVDAVVVTATGVAQRQMESTVSTGTVTGPQLRELKASHPAEVVRQVAGAWVSVSGSGEGHMTAIRQPLTTNPVYLYLEDGVPTRSTGFFNHNALYEINVPQAGRLEVLKGPGTALYGSDAIGGVVNVETRAPALERTIDVYGEAGGHGWNRGTVSLSGSRGPDGVRADFNYTRWSGWRDDAGYDRQSGTVRWDRALGENARLKTVATFSRIDQIDPSPLGRAGFEATPESNEYPIAIREIRAFRFSTAYDARSGGTSFNITPFLRWNEMNIVPSWMLSFDPVMYTTGHRSVGMTARARREVPLLRSSVTAGVDVEYSPGAREEYQIAPDRAGSVFTSYERGALIYDYDVTFHGISPYVQVEARPVARLHLSAGARYDAVGFRYDNHLDIVETGRYRRPADTDVRFEHFSPKLGFAYEAAPYLGVFGSYRHSFRAPSEGQLFRQGSSINTIGLDPVRADAYEMGVRGALGGRADYEMSVYDMRVHDDVLTYIRPDNQREVQNAGETRHRGIELALGVNVADWLRLSGAYSNARHTYESWQPRAGLAYDGNEMATAPREIVNVGAHLRPSLLNGGAASAELVRIGRYWEDPENTSRYEGHTLLNLRASYRVSHGVELIGRVLNVTDARYAENATYTATEGERLTPGAPRMIYLGVQGTWPTGNRR